MRSWLLISVALACLIGLLAINITGCSGDSNPAAPEPGLSVFPAAGPPGTPLTLIGIRVDAADVPDLEIRLGGEIAPVLLAPGGKVKAAIPLFLGGSGWPEPPAGALTLTVSLGDRLLGKAERAVTVTPLDPAPGATAAMAANFKQAVGSLKVFLASLEIEPGVSDQYLTAAVAVLDSLTAPAGTYSLEQSLALLAEDQAALALLDAVHAGAGLVAWSDDLARTMGALAALATDPGGKAAWNVGDRNLARMMQFHEILALFGKEVIDATGSTFAETVGLAAGLLGIAGPSLPQVTATQLILAYLDFVFNKVLIGCLPSRIERFDLELAAEAMGPGETTDAAMSILARNEPPQISLQYVISNLLGLLGAANSSPAALEHFKDFLLATTNFFLGTTQGVIKSYALLHPELNLDVDLGSAVPDMSWAADLSDPVLVDCMTLTPDLLTPLEGGLNWQAAEDKVGEGRIYIRPAVGGAAHLLPLPPGIEYNGFAFGNNDTMSVVRAVTISRTLVVEAVAPGKIVAGESGVLEIRAGYEQSGGAVSYQAGVDIALGIEGGTLEAASGITDAEGRFTTRVAADVPEAKLILLTVNATAGVGESAEDNIRIPVVQPSGMAAFLGLGMSGYGYGLISEFYPWPNEHRVDYFAEPTLPYLDFIDDGTPMDCFHRSEVPVTTGQTVEGGLTVGSASLLASCTVGTSSVSFTLTNHVHAPRDFHQEAHNGAACAVYAFNGEPDTTSLVLSWDISNTQFNLDPGRSESQAVALAKVKLPGCAYPSHVELDLWELSSYRYTDPVTLGRVYQGSYTIPLAPGLHEVVLDAGTSASSTITNTEFGGAPADVSIAFTLEMVP